MRCPAASGSATYTDASPCTWTRKLCVSCSTVDSVVYITAQTNGLPNHCHNSTVNNNSASGSEWTVTWNADMSGIENYADADFDTSAETDEVLCDIQRTSTSNLNAATTFSGDDAVTAGGLAITGTYIYNALALGNADAVEGELETLDVCASHPSPQGNHHYHYWGACMHKSRGHHSQTAVPDLCRDASGCLTSTNTYMRDSVNTVNTDYTYTAATYDTPIGLAKDGHVIIGPYMSTGSVWTCDDRDVCNGATISGSYVYVGSDTFPYMVGCWGPGPSTHTYMPTCTSTGCGTVVVSTGAVEQISAAIATLAVAAALF